MCVYIYIYYGTTLIEHSSQIVSKRQVLGASTIYIYIYISTTNHPFSCKSTINHRFSHRRCFIPKGPTVNPRIRNIWGIVHHLPSQMLPWPPQWTCRQNTTLGMVYGNRLYHSMGWLKGKSTGNRRFSHEILDFPVVVPLNQSIEPPIYGQ